MKLLHWLNISKHIIGGKMKYVFDIDGTICTNTNGKYEQAMPYSSRIEMVNKLYDEGHTVIFHTARGMGSTNNNVYEAYNKWYGFTESQLKRWGVKYNMLLLGKPSGDFYVDDKGVKDEEFF